MKTNLVRAALGCAVLVFAAPAAYADVKPIQGTVVGLEHDPSGIIATAPTDGDGRVTFRNLAPGKYVVVVHGKELGTAYRTVVGAKGDLGGTILSVSVGGTSFSTATPLCRDAQDRDIRVGFTIRDRAGSAGPVVVHLGISDQGASGNLSSY
jgi:hypothetical protein